VSADLAVRRVSRDVIVPLRRRVLSLPGGAVTTLGGDLGPETRHWAALAGDDVVGCVSVMALRGWALRGMAVSPERRRQGVGARLLAVVCDDVNAAMWCNARRVAVPFYAAMGWVAMGPQFVLGEGGLHQRMVWHGDAET